MASRNNYFPRNINSFKNDVDKENEPDSCAYQFEIITTVDKRSHQSRFRYYCSIDNLREGKSKLGTNEGGQDLSTINASCPMVPNRPLSDITLSISNTNERESLLKIMNSKDSARSFEDEDYTDSFYSLNRFSDVAREIENLDDGSKFAFSIGVPENCFNPINEASTSSSTSGISCPFSENDSLLDLLTPDFLSIDQQGKSQDSNEFSNTKWNNKFPCTYKIKRSKNNASRKLKFTSDWRTAKTCQSVNENKCQADHKTYIQSSINDYFKIQKSSQNINKNIDILAAQNITESTEINLNHFTPHCESKITGLTESQKKISRKMLEISKDTSLIYGGPTVVFDDQIKMNKDQEIFTGVTEEMIKFVISLKEANDYHSCESEMTAIEISIYKPPLSLPYDIKQKQRHTAVMIFLLGKIFSLICHNSRSSQRQVYYEIKQYVSNQQYIASCLTSICMLIKVEPWYLPITSTGKGLVFGNLKIITSNNDTISCLNFGGTSIPQDVLQIKEFQSDAAFILVVEKDAVFKKLLDEEICKVLATSCIVITGKGFPDYNTRLFSKLLWRHLRIPIFILTDGDPYGIEIMLTYRCGSVKKPFFSEDITIPDIQWLGILPTEIEKLQIPCEDLSQTEIAKVSEMLKRPYVQQYDWLRRELKFMLKYKKKAGIERVSDNYKSLTKFYLSSKLVSGDFV